MARQVRIEYAGAYYHVISRGDRRENIFWSDRDRGIFLKTLGEACEKTGWKIDSYVLINNHYHLLLNTPEANLVKGMKWLQGVYTQRFNNANKQCGHLFQGRYKALPIEKDDYFKTLSDYIHFNPVRSKLIRVKQGHLLESYRWSSYWYFIKPPKIRPSWLRSELVFQSYGIIKDTARTRREYQHKLEERAVGIFGESKKEQDQRYKALRRGWYVGGKQFGEELVARVKGCVEFKSKNSFHGKGVRKHDEQEALKVLDLVIKELKISLKDLLPMNKTSVEKGVVAWALRKYTAVSRKWVSEQLNMGAEQNVSKLAKQIEEDDKLKAKRRRLQRMLQSSD